MRRTVLVVFAAVLISFCAFYITSLEAAEKNFTFKFNGKMVKMGCTVAALKALWPQVKAAEAEGGFSPVLELSLDKTGSDKTHFKFKKDKLAAVDLTNGDTGGPGQSIAAFEKWLTATHGSGKVAKSEPPQEVTQWTVGQATITRNFYGDPESGDTSTSFTIVEEIQETNSACCCNCITQNGRNVYLWSQNCERLPEGMIACSCTAHSQDECKKKEGYQD